MNIKVYIAGKISGDPNYAEKFQIVENEAKLLGYIPLSPANLPEGMSKADYMRICFSMIDCADAVVFLPDWESSPGATLEHMYCEYTEKMIVFI